MNKSPVIVSLVALACLAGAPAHAAEQEETFVVPESGADNVDGAKLGTLANRNDPRAINNIGWLWARGEGGVRQDYAEAMKWFKHAAKMGYTVAMNNVGLLYANGHGVERSDEEAFKWWMRSAEKGDAWAMNAVGDMYETGAGVQQSYELALMWYREAAREGDGLAMWNVAHLSESGLGTDRNLDEALQWYQQSAERGYGPSIYRLGLAYENGEAREADLVEAWAHYAVAKSRFTPEDASEAEANSERLARLEGRLSAAQRDAASVREKALAERYRRPEPATPATGGTST